MKLNQLVEMRTRTRDRAADAFSHKVSSSANIFLHEFDRGRGTMMRHVIDVGRMNYQPLEQDFIEIDPDEELFTMRMNVSGWLRDKRDFSFTAMYDGDDEEFKKMLRKKEQIPDDIHETKEYKNLLLALKGLIDHLRYTANLKYVLVGTEFIKADKVNLEPWIKDIVREVNGGILVDPRYFKLYLKVPRKSK